MKIQMPAVINEAGSLAASASKENQLIRKANSIFVSSFKLRLSPDPHVQKYELGVLLRVARSNPRYKSNAANYQFKLKSDSQGQYITLKQQGWWSSFKGMFGWGREAREKQRTDAMDLINLKLGRYIGPTGTDGEYMELGHNDRLNFANAKSYQTNVFNSMGLGPSARGANSETPNMEDLKNELTGSSAFLKEDEPNAVKSFVYVDHNSTGHKLAPERQFVMPNDLDGGAGRKNPLDRDPTVNIDEVNQQFAGSPESPEDALGSNSFGIKGKALAGYLSPKSILVNQLLDESYGSNLYD